jgi:hypothetical protein
VEGLADDRRVHRRERVGRRAPGRYLIALIAPILLGCSTYSAVRYSPMAETVAMLRAHRGAQVNVGQFTARNPRGSYLVCRLGAPIHTPDDEPFEEFVRKAFVTELVLAELYSPTAPVTLAGFLDDFDFSTAEGRWKITLVLSSSNGQALTVTETYDYGFHFLGEVASRQTAHALTPAIQNLVRSTVQHPQFAALLATGR